MARRSFKNRMFLAARGLRFARNSARRRYCVDRRTGEATCLIQRSSKPLTRRRMAPQRAPPRALKGRAAKQLPAKQRAVKQRAVKQRAVKQRAAKQLAAKRRALQAPNKAWNARDRARP